MAGRRTQTVETVTLSQLVVEEFGTSPGQLVDALADKGVAVVVDDKGRLAVTHEAAEALREERRETRRRESEERAERERVAAEAAAKTAAENKRRQEITNRRNERIRRLERASGVSIIQLEIALRNSIINEPNSGMSYDARQAADDRAFTLDELEQFVRQTYGDEMMDGVRS